MQSQITSGNTPNYFAPQKVNDENGVHTIRSIEPRDLINDARVAAGEPKVRNDQFLSRVEHELGDELEKVQKYSTPVHVNQVAIYSLTLDQCMLVGMRESKAVRRSVLTKLKSLEEPRIIATLPDFSNSMAAARAWADQTEQKKVAQQALAVVAPKVEFVDRYVDSSGLKVFRQTAKLLRANEARFREFLIFKKVMYHMGGEWQAYLQHIDAGRFDIKTGTSECGHPFNQAKFTPKGVTWVAGLWAQFNLEVE
ncbi:phage antirepressor protein [Pseudomonas putida]|nr:phage antirepressor protein [Pseudomonas putida]